MDVTFDKREINRYYNNKHYGFDDGLADLDLEGFGCVVQGRITGAVVYEEVAGECWVHAAVDVVPLSFVQYVATFFFHYLNKDEVVFMLNTECKTIKKSMVLLGAEEETPNRFKLHKSRCNYLE